PAEAAQQVLEVDRLGPAAGRAEADVAGPAATGTAEHLGEQVLEPGAAPTAAATGGEPGAAAGHGADGVVLLALLGVGQDGVGLPDVLELLLGGRVTGLGVGVPLARQLAVRLLDRGLVGVLGHAEDRVEVLVQPVLVRHPRSPPSGPRPGARLAGHRLVI